MNAVFTANRNKVMELQPFLSVLVKGVVKNIQVYKARVSLISSPFKHLFLLNLN